MKNLLPVIRRQKHKSKRTALQLWMWLVDLNYNFECDWPIELSDSKLTDNKVSNNKVSNNKLSNNKLSNNKLSDNNLVSEFSGEIGVF